MSREKLVEVAREIEEERIAAGLRFSPVLDRLDEPPGSTGLGLGKADPGETAVESGAASRGAGGQRQNDPEEPRQLSLFASAASPGADAPDASRAARLRDVFPSYVTPVLALGENGLSIVELKWGFAVPWSRGPVFNTRVETAMSQRRNMWTDAFQRRRCIVVASAFYERSTEPSDPRAEGGQKKLFRFTLPDGALLAMAGVYEAGCFSIVTCPPNRWVSGIHPRMPLAFALGEAPLWLTDDYPKLLDRSRFELDAR